MKKQLLTIIILVFSTATTYATHIFGGELKTWLVDTNGQKHLHVELRLMRDVIGVGLAPSASIKVVYDDTIVVYHSAVLTNSPYNPLVSANYPGVITIELYIYKAQFNPPANAKKVYVSYDNCCRNAAISNIHTPTSEGYHIFSELKINQGVNSELPVLTELAAVCATGDSVSISNFTVDPDGDSLYYELVVPLGMNTLPVTSYTLPPSNSLLPFQINPYSGILTWLPNTIGIYAYRIKITEFRYDTITQTYNTLAIHNKDLGIMSLLIPPSVSFLMAPIPNSTLLPNGAKMVQFKDQQSNDLLLSFTGVSASNFSLNPFGGPFAFDPLQTNIIRNVIDGNSVDYILSWSPSPQYVGNGPYMFVVRITHHGITYDMLMAIQVISSVGISEAEIYRVNMFPNPISGGEFLQIALNGVIGHTGELIISDQSGRVVLAQQIDAGVNQVLIPAHLPRGLYIATIQGEEAVVVEKLMVR